MALSQAFPNGWHLRGRMHRSRLVSGVRSTFGAILFLSAGRYIRYYWSCQWAGIGAFGSCSACMLNYLHERALIALDCWYHHGQPRRWGRRLSQCPTVTTSRSLGWTPTQINADLTKLMNTFTYVGFELHKVEFATAQNYNFGCCV